MKTPMKESTAHKLITRWAPLGIATAMIASPLVSAPDDGEKSADKFAEELGKDLQRNGKAFRDLVRQAVENGGKLELGLGEFEKLMGKRSEHFQKGEQIPTEEEVRAMMREAWMRQIGQRAQAADDDTELPDAGEAMKGFMDLFQRRVSNRKAGKNEKEHRSVLLQYRPVVSEARSSTVALVAGRKQVSLGTVVDSAGFVVTKASEVEGKDLRCVFSGGVRVAAKIVDVYQPLDLALVKVGADGLEVADWLEDNAVVPGSFLAASGIGEDAIAIGVASVAPRTLSEKRQGFLGVRPVSTDDGVRLEHVHEGTPAAKAGLESGDLVLEIDATPISSHYELHRMISGRSPGEKLKFRVQRDGDEKDFVATLESREMADQLNGGARRQPRNSRIDRMNSMGGDLSGNRGGYASAMQTDLTLEPFECGGPLVNLDGKVVGVNIARGGRVKSYAIPVADLKALLSDVDSGKFSVTDISELKRVAAVADEALKKAEAAMKAAREAKQAADRALKKAEKQ